MNKMTKIFGLALIAALMAGTSRAEPGLNGAYYVLGFGAGSVSNALTDISSLTPTATFIATTVCFPSCGTVLDDGGSTISDFLGGNAIDLSSNSINDLSFHVVVLTGELNIPTAGTYTFGIGSDDGSELVIDGITLLNDGDHSFQTETSNFTLSAGQHAIEIVQFENQIFTGLTVTENSNPLGGSDISTTAAAVPEPASAALLLAGLTGLVAARWRGMAGPTNRPPTIR